MKPEDFFVPPGETLESAPKRELYVEATLVFPELAAGDKDAEKTVPATFKHMIVDGAGKTPFARIRLEATWQTSGTLDGVIEENAYWLLAPGEVAFGDIADATVKQKSTATDRASVAVRYIPASRDVATLTKLTVRSLGRSLFQSIVWENKEEITKLISEASAALDKESALSRLNDAINNSWTALNTADTETKARLSVLSPEFQQIVRAAAIALDPSATGRRIGVEDLSDGQRSLFHFALVKSLLELKLSLEADVAAGKTPPFNPDFMKAPALTLFAFEEPENHLAPYFLARLLGELQKLTATNRVQGVITSHSPAIVGRLEPTAVRHMRRDSKSGVAKGSPLVLPPHTDEASKFVREAVRAHPEIYFARHAIFGEGASEEIVFPRLAEALGVPVDRSFVAIVPVGGRHVQHFWRLVSQLGIPHTTVLDFDLGRSNGDISGIVAVAKSLKELNIVTDETGKKNLETAIALNKSTWGGPSGWTEAQLSTWGSFFEGYGVFFSDPLDLDMLMLMTFPDAYKTLEQGAHGPQDADDATRQSEACIRVLGQGGFGAAAYAGGPCMPYFPWYAYLFLGNRGKPAIHIGALGRISDEDLKTHCPAVFKRLIDHVEKGLLSSAA